MRGRLAHHRRRRVRGAVLVALVNLVDGLFAIPLREEIDVLRLVADGNEALQTQLLKSETRKLMVINVDN